MKFKEIDERMKKLCASPMKRIPGDRMEKVLSQLGDKTIKSKKMFEEANEVLPGGIEHMLSHTTPWPVYIESAKGPYLTDVDGNRYIDYMFGGGPVILGHNPDNVLEKVMEAVRSKGWFHGRLTNSRPWPRAGSSTACRL